MLPQASIEAYHKIVVLLILIHQKPFICMLTIKWNKPVVDDCYVLCYYVYDVVTVFAAVEVDLGLVLVVVVHLLLAVGPSGLQSGKVGHQDSTKHKKT